jgi:hypothetical protein
MIGSAIFLIVKARKTYLFDIFLQVKTKNNGSSHLGAPFLGARCGSVSRLADLQPGGGELAAVGHPPAPGAELEKTRFFKNKTQPSGFFCFFLFFFGFYFFIFAQKREFLGFFSVSIILLDASRR